MKTLSKTLCYLALLFGVLFVSANCKHQHKKSKHHGPSQNRQHKSHKHHIHQSPHQDFLDPQETDQRDQHPGIHPFNFYDYNGITEESPHYYPSRPLTEEPGYRHPHKLTLHKPRRFHHPHKLALGEHLRDLYYNQDFDNYGGEPRHIYPNQLPIEEEMQSRYQNKHRPVEQSQRSLKKPNYLQVSPYRLGEDKYREAPLTPVEDDFSLNSNHKSQHSSEDVHPHHLIELSGSLYKNGEVQGPVAYRKYKSKGKFPHKYGKNPKKKIVRLSSNNLTTKVPSVSSVQLNATKTSASSSAVTEYPAGNHTTSQPNQGGMIVTVAGHKNVSTTTTTTIKPSNTTLTSTILTTLKPPQKQVRRRVAHSFSK